MESVDSLADWVVGGPYGGFVRRHVAIAGGAHLIRLAQPEGSFPDPPNPDLTIQVIERAPRHARVDLGAGAFGWRPTRRQFVVTPAGTLNHFDITGAHEITVATLPWAEVAALLPEASGGRLSDLGPLHRAAQDCPRVTGVLDLLWQAADAEAPATKLYTDGLRQALVGALVALALGGPGARPAALPPWRRKRAEALLADRLDEEIGIAEVAAAVGLSPFHFARAFKATTGLAPHAWRNARRIAEAQALLADHRRPIAAVAAACGFASQAHFTHAFRRATGEPPGAWRRARMG